MLNLALITDYQKAINFIKFFNSKKLKLENKAAEKIKIKYIFDPNFDQKQLKDSDESSELMAELRSKIISSKFDKILTDPDLDLVLELNNEASSLDLFLDCLKKSKSIISSNKKIIAENYSLLKDYELKYQAKIYFSAVFSPLPLAELMENFYLFDELKEIRAIFNSTTNYILSEMARNTISMKETIEKAKAESFVEKNPDIDLGGLDSLYETILSANLIYQTAFNSNQTEYKGIKGITSYDLIYAKELGYKIKLLAKIKKEKNSLKVGVRPVLLAEDCFLAAVNNNSNAIELYSEDQNKVVLEAKNSTEALFNLLLLDLFKYLKEKNNFKSFEIPKVSKLKLNNLYKLQKNIFYIRLQVEKNEIVINKIKDIFSEQNLAELILHDNLTETPLLPVIVITKEIKEADLEEILKEVENLEGVLTVNNIIPIQKN